MTDQPSTIQQGDTVIIPAGVVVKTMHPSRDSFVTTRKMTVKAHHLLEGTEISVYWFQPDREEYPQFATYFDRYDDLLLGCPDKSGFGHRREVA